MNISEIELHESERNQELRAALRGVLDHYHQPCPGCWAAIKRAHEALGESQAVASTPIQTAATQEGE